MSNLSRVDRLPKMQATSGARLAANLEQYGIIVTDVYISDIVRAASISAALISYLQTTKWDGKLPQVTGGAIPFFNVPAVSEGTTTP